MLGLMPIFCLPVFGKPKKIGYQLVGYQIALSLYRNSLLLFFGKFGISLPEHWLSSFELQTTHFV
jgi:hypothetical protein